MVLQHEGAVEGGRGLLAFFSGNPLVMKVNGRAEMKEVAPLDYQEVGNLYLSTVSRDDPRPKNRRA